MFQEEFSMVVNASKAKLALLKTNGLGYFVSSMMAGVYVGFGIALIFTIGGLLTGLPYAKILMGVSFGIALSLVIMAGSELFTGNNLVMTAGIFSGQVKWKEAIKLWVVCYFGNWLGSIVLALLFVGGGYATGPVGEFIAATAAAKISIAFFPLLLRGVLCNILVCLAVWCSFKCKSESGKLIMIFWCLFAFITTGFEHSIANMTLLTIGLVKPFAQNITLTGYLYNILVVSAGNMIGGILFVSLPYYLISKKKGV